METKFECVSEGIWEENGMGIHELGERRAVLSVGGAIQLTV